MENTVKKIKKLQELTIKNNFMFCAVMMEPSLCKPMLERTLGIEIQRIEVNRERCFIYNPEYKSIVLDIYAKDENNTHYNVEMQAVRKTALLKRSRYYHSQIDMEILDTGCEYRELPNVYVIFICDFDPFGQGKYRYTCGSYCKETGNWMDDGCRTIFLSTVGQDEEEVPKELVKFLKFVHAELEESQDEWNDEYIRTLQKRVAEIKESRKMGGMYMHIMEVFGDEFLDEIEEAREEARAEGREEGRAEGRAEGREEGRAEGRAEGREEGRAEGHREGFEKGQLELLHSQIIKHLTEKSAVPEELQTKIQNETDKQVLEQWLVDAIICKTTEEFTEKIKSR